MVIFDASVLIVYLSYSDGDVDGLKVANLIDELTKSNTVVGIPAPAWAEFIVRSDEGTTKLIESIRKRSSIRILPFDAAAAYEAAYILRGAFDQTGNKKANSNGTWPKIKYDRQIIAIAKVNKATMIYSDDDGLIGEANRVGLNTTRSSELPLPQVQTSIDFSQQGSSV